MYICITWNSVLNLCIKGVRINLNFYTEGFILYENSLYEISQNSSAIQVKILKRFSYRHKNKINKYVHINIIIMYLILSVWLYWQCDKMTVENTFLSFYLDLINN